MSNLKRIIYMMKRVAIVIPTGAVGFWRGESSAIDSSGNGNNGTLGANTTFNGAGHLGSSFVFDTTDASKVSIPSINVGSPYSLEFWFKLNALPSTAVHLVSNDFNSATKYGAMYVIVDSGVRKLSYYRNGTELFRLSNALATGIWYKVLYEYDGTRSSLWFNDLLSDVDSVGHTGETFNNAMAFGQAVSNESHAPSGEIDEVVLYNRLAGVRGLVCQLDGENNANDTLGNWNFSAGGSQIYTASGHTNKGFLFTGSTAEVVTGAIPLGDNFSIDFWMKPSSNSSGFVHTISGAWNSAQYGALYYRPSGNLEYWQGSSNRMTASGVITTGAWNRVTYTRTAADSKSRLYVNGILVATESGTHVEALNKSAAINLGYGGESTVFSGTIDDVKFYNNLILP